jgi:Mce-associated membrane protein
MAVDADSAGLRLNYSAIIEPDISAAVERESPARPNSGARLALAVLMVTLAAVGGLAGWLGNRAHQASQGEQQREVFLQIGRQAALNLTTIDYTKVDIDIQRVLDSSTGTFHDDFQKRSPAFADVVRQAKSKSEGTVAEAGFESVTDNTAQVLVAVSVKTSNIDPQQQQPRNWRMRIGVEKVDDGVKVSSVGFVP